jgi:hypothetical protein
LAGRGGAVRVSIFADTKDLERGAARGEQSLGRLSKAGVHTGSTFAGASKHLLGFAAASVGIGGALYAAKGAISATEDLAKNTIGLHNATGLSIKSSSEWGAVAQSRGVETTKLAQSFAILSTHVRDAEGGSKKQIETFKTLGVTQGQLNATGGDLNKVLFLLADKFHNMPGSVNKVATAKALLGRQWQTLLPC